MRKKFVVGALFATLVATLAGTCAARGLCSYTGTDQLGADPKFRPALKQLLRNKTFQSGAYTVNALDRVVLNMVGPPGKIEALQDGMYLATACRYRDCGDKVALILACPNRVVAAAIVDYNARPKLAVFSSNRSQSLKAAVAKWKTAIEQETGMPLEVEWHRQQER
ncbi:hypothetical protein [Massilia sp. PWRC2]|uniref:hypothetical protein n=1 Tax=Massilia sp. PWRC2 TaxID=2804626 RepID=UPI003CF883CB